MKKAAVRHRDSRDSRDDCLLTILLSTEFSWFSWAFTSSVFRGWISASESLLSIAAHSSVFRCPSPPSPATTERAVGIDFGIYIKKSTKIFWYYPIFMLETFNGRWANQCTVTELDTKHHSYQRSPTWNNGERLWDAGTALFLLQRRKSALLDPDKDGYSPYAGRTNWSVGLPQEKHAKSSFCCKDFLPPPVYVTLTPGWRGERKHSWPLYPNIRLFPTVMSTWASPGEREREREKQTPVYSV